MAARKIKDARNKHIDEKTPQTWTAMMVATAELNGLNSQHANERRWGPHTLADQQSYDRLSSKLQNRKEIRAGIREHENFMYQLRGDGRDEDADTRLQRLHYIRMVETGEMTSRQALELFNRIRPRLVREWNDIEEDYRGEREYEALVLLSRMRWMAITIWLSHRASAHWPRLQQIARIFTHLKS